MEPRLAAVLADFASGGGASGGGIDMSRMALVLRRRRLSALDAAESRPEGSVVDAVVPNFLHAPGGALLPQAMDELGRVARMEGEPAAFWLALAQRRLVEAPRVCVVGRPSKALGASMAQAEAGRLAAQKERLGPARLEELRLALEAAAAANDEPFPPEVLRQFPTPSVESISVHRVCTVRSAQAPPAEGEPPLPAPPAELAEDAALVARLPVAAQFDHVQSAFVEVGVTVRTGGLSARERALVPLVLALLFESGVQRSAGLVPHADVVREIADATLSVGASLGFGGGRFGPGAFGELVSVSARAAADKYSAVVALLADCIFRGVLAARAPSPPNCRRHVLVHRRCPRRPSEHRTFF